MTLGKKLVGWTLVLVVTAVAGIACALSHTSRCPAPHATTAGPGSMRAALARCYGSPEVVTLEYTALPTLTDDHVLVRVRASSVNPLDWHMMRGEPYLERAMVGLGMPTDGRMGVDFAGTVEAVGRSVTRFKPGDDVFGGADGAFAEYVSVREGGSIALKPANATFEEAAAVPIAGVTALQAVRDYGHARAGQNVLVNGASGGVGTFAVQIAKAFGARVTGVCSTRNVALVQRLGADRVIDYTHDDFTQGAERYDLIVDTVGTHSFSDYRRVLTPHGSLVMVGALDKGKWLGPMSKSLVGMAVAPFVSQNIVFMLAHLNARDLGVLGDLMAQGKLTPAIDRRYPLAELPQAISYLELGHAHGKVVVLP
jgi:NADPH:quinone reductase-like Zn-dependent oxidoreductase